MSPVEHVWDLFGRRLTRDPRPAASKDEFWHTSNMGYLPQADIKKVFESMPRRIESLITACGGYTKY